MMKGELKKQQKQKISQLPPQALLLGMYQLQVLTLGVQQRVELLRLMLLQLLRLLLFQHSHKSMIMISKIQLLRSKMPHHQ